MSTGKHSEQNSAIDRLKQAAASLAATQLQDSLRLVIVVDETKVVPQLGVRAKVSSKLLNLAGRQRRGAWLD